MNYITLIILATLIAETVVSAVADILNLKALRHEVPDVFKDVCDPEQYRKSQEYLRVRTQFGWIEGIFFLTVTLGFWFGKGFPLSDAWVRSFDQGPVISGLIFIGILGVAKSVIGLPFDIYSTFVIEERFGFNKTTVSTFIKDRIKGFALGVLLGCPLLAAILAFFEYFASHAWVYCWMAVTLYMLVLRYAAPTWIMPLFNKFEPLPDGELKSSIMAYAKSVDFGLQHVFVMDGSRRSSKSNAFFTGFGKNKRIALYDTLIGQHTVPEIIAVLAHEIGHYRKKHILTGLMIGIVHAGLMFYLLSVFLSSQKLFDAFYMTDTSVYAGLIFFGMLFSPLDFFLGIIVQIISRKNEYQADRFAADTTKDPGSMASALKKLSSHNLSNLTPHPFYVFLHYSHPPVIERIQAISTGELSR